MKEFDLEAAKNGAPVVTRDGKAARIVCFYRKDDTYPIIALVNEEEKEDYYSYTKDGRLCAGKDHSVDLFMAPVKKKGWINIYPFFGDLGPTKIAECSYVFAFEGDANNAAAEDRLACVEVEWEE